MNLREHTGLHPVVLFVQIQNHFLRATHRINKRGNLRNRRREFLSRIRLKLNVRLKTGFQRIDITLGNIRAHLQIRNVTNFRNGRTRADFHSHLQGTGCDCARDRSRDGTVRIILAWNRGINQGNYLTAVYLASQGHVHLHDFSPDVRINVHAALRLNLSVGIHVIMESRNFRNPCPDADDIFPLTAGTESSETSESAHSALVL